MSAVPRRPSPFDSLARAVDTEWAKFGRDPDQFTQIATRSLTSLEYQLTQEQLEDQLAGWFQSNSHLPDQVQLHNTFGQPPITLFNDGRFVVEVYIWMGCDTSIHSHGFRGAFRLLQGVSLHETFSVKTVEAVAHDVELTQLGRPLLEILKAGDTRVIAAGRELTHRVIHLEEPTITLCVKTLNESKLSQWHHFENGLAIQKRQLDPGLIKQIYFFQYLAGQNGTRSLDFLNALLDRQDISTLMNLCEEISGSGFDLADDISQTILERVYDRYRETEWFARYERSAQDQNDDIAFSNSGSAVGRLATHLLNQRYGFAEVSKLLELVSGKAVSKNDVEDQIVSMIDPENPLAQIHLERMRAFLNG